MSWGNVTRTLLERALLDAPEVSEKIAGVVLNRVDERRFRLFESYAERGYGYTYHSTYSSRVEPGP